MSNRPNRPPARPAGATGAAARSGERGRDGTRLVVIGVVVLVAVAALVAIGLSVLDDGDDAVVVSSGGQEVEAVETAEVLVDGESLPPAGGTGEDPAVGAVGPGLEGFTHTGEPVEIFFDGRPKMIFFLAHWCPHCQRELPQIADWLADGGPGDDVDVYVVATGQDDRAPNWPPSAWFAREGIDVATTPTLMDSPDADAATAYGLASYPYLVVLDAENEVVARTSGELAQVMGMGTSEALDTLAELAVSGVPSR